MATAAMAIIPAAFWASIVLLAWGWLAAIIVVIAALLGSIFVIALVRSGGEIETPVCVPSTRTGHRSSQPGRPRRRKRPNAVPTRPASNESPGAPRAPLNSEPRNRMVTSGDETCIIRSDADPAHEFACRIPSGRWTNYGEIAECVIAVTPEHRRTLSGFTVANLLLPLLPAPLRGPGSVTPRGLSTFPAPTSGTTPTCRTAAINSCATRAARFLDTTPQRPTTSAPTNSWRWSRPARTGSSRPAPPIPTSPPASPPSGAAETTAVGHLSPSAAVPDGLTSRPSSGGTHPQRAHPLTPSRRSG